MFDSSARGTPGIPFIVSSNRNDGWCVFNSASIASPDGPDSSDVSTAERCLLCDLLRGDRTASTSTILVERERERPIHRALIVECIGKGRELASILRTAWSRPRRVSVASSTFCSVWEVAGTGAGVGIVAVRLRCLRKVSDISRHVRFSMRAALGSWSRCFAYMRHICVANGSSFARAAGSVSSKAPPRLPPLSFGKKASSSSVLLIVSDAFILLQQLLVRGHDGWRNDTRSGWMTRMWKNVGREP